MKYDFSDKSIAITGAAGGLGTLLSEFFVTSGARVFGLDKNVEVETMSEKLGGQGQRFRGVAIDLGDGAAVQQAFDNFGEVDILINMAAVSSRPTMKKTDPESWQEDIAANLNAAYHCARSVLPGMSERRRGVIVSIGSANGTIGLGEPSYSAAKAGMVSLTRSIAIEYGRYGIRCNIIVPGTIRTPFWDKRKEKDPHVLDSLLKWYPLGRIVDPQEMIQTIAFLASEASSAITGASLPVDCGLTAGNLVMARELLVEEL